MVSNPTARPGRTPKHVLIRITTHTDEDDPTSPTSTSLGYADNDEKFLGDYAVVERDIIPSVMELSALCDSDAESHHYAAFVGVHAALATLLLEELADEVLVCTVLWTLAEAGGLHRLVTEAHDEQNPEDADGTPRESEGPAA